MAALEADDKLIEQLGELDAAERPGPKLLQESAVHHLETLGDREDLADATRNLAGALVGELIGEILDRRGIGGDAEQARPGLVVQLVGDRAALLLLHGDELAIEAAILVARGVDHSARAILESADSVACNTRSLT